MVIEPLPETYKSLVYDKPGVISIAINEVPLPTPGTGEVLVKLTHSGVCHSDLGIMTNSVGGHEGVGAVVAFGPGAEASGLALGDRVGIKWMRSISGYFTPGTFQQYTVSPANYVTPIPASLPSELAAPLLCGGLTTYSALKRCRAVPGDWVVVSGSGGGLGHLALQIGSRGMGFRMIGIDTGDKEKISKDSGAEAFISLDDYSNDAQGAAQRAQMVKEVAGGMGAASVIVCAGSNAAYAQALDFLRFNGTVVCVGLPGGEKVPLPNAYPSKFITAQLSVIGTAVGNRKEAIEVLEMASRGIIKTRVTVEKMTNLADVFQRMKSGKVHGRVVLDLSG
ncbi:hypothetical protein LCI18_013948 [Fusarium solani-melongenae]|uniref:Uncharacterized protein n=1 Tax=Fusarium solani subsp. cucurbitae TaxID=2747967 RepID=A0ACD3ZNV6_FUSSC|nr:hypothetical protein LCI18_013948 [Fusarium solani-melongenae]